MSDLPHTYAGDILYQETMVYGADTQFAAQKLGSNTNYLLDEYPVISSTLTAIAAAAAKIDYINADGAYGPGDHYIYHNPNGVFIAFFCIGGLRDNLSIASTTTGLGFFFGLVPGPAVPIIVVKDNPFGNYNYYHSTAGGPNVWLNVTDPATGHQDIKMTLVGSSGGLLVRGLVFHG